MRLSIIVPFYNEARTLATLLERAAAAELPAGMSREMVLVDDGSTDASHAIAATFAETQPAAKLVTSAQNRGKGAAIRAGLAAASGDIVLVQDADLEWDPADYARLLSPYADPGVEVVFGARRRADASRPLYYHYDLGGRLLTAWTNLLFGSRITDQPTGFKSFRRRAVDEFALSAEGFDFDAEVTARLLQAGHVIKEVPVRYVPRTFRDGKKVRARDGLRALWLLLRIRLEGMKGRR